MIDNKTKLIVLRGPSGSGKSSIARAVRSAQTEQMALIEQDYLRRVLLKEKHSPNGLNIQLIKRTVLFALENSYHVILEGIFEAACYEKMFEEIIQIHPLNNYFFYFDISFEETLRRHQFKPNKHDFGEEEMRRWYKSRDLLSCVPEYIIPETFAVEATVDTIFSVCGLLKPV